MKKFTKDTLISIGLNFLSVILLLSPVYLNLANDSLSWAIGAFFILVLSLCIQLIVGLVFLVNENKKLIGQAMLLALGIIILIGFSICGGAFI
jgi:hypothetical protein